MGKNTSISLGPRFEKFIKSEISTGRYNSTSEVIRAALRLLEEEEKKIEVLNKALEKGERSSMVSDFDPGLHLQSLHKDKGL